MALIDLNNSNLVVRKDATIKEAMAAINDNHRGTVVVVDEKGKMEGILSDGNIRRSLVQGRDINSEVEEIINMNPVFVIDSEESQSKTDKIFNERPEINLIPIVDKENKLVDAVIRKVE